MSKIRYFKCPIPKCDTVTGFDINRINNVNENIVVCSGCKKKWVATKMSSCCSVEVLFVTMESGSKKPIYSQQTFPK